MSYIFYTKPTFLLSQLGPRDPGFPHERHTPHVEFSVGRTINTLYTYTPQRNVVYIFYTKSTFLLSRIGPRGPGFSHGQHTLHVESSVGRTINIL